MYFGAGHDGQSNHCPIRGHIMEPASCKDCGRLATQWSNCTRDSVNMYFASSDTKCLDKPAAPMCGNGRVDAGEECDSGSARGSACCTAQCKLRKGAQCDDRNGKCCNSCRLVARGTRCARALPPTHPRGSCDAPDTCDGAQPVCHDAVQPNGALCTDPTAPKARLMDLSAAAVCNNGICVSRPAACAKASHTYDPECNKGENRNPCTLYCRSSASGTCVRLSYKSPLVPLQVVAPDYVSCDDPSKKIVGGWCLKGQCQKRDSQQVPEPPSKGTLFVDQRQGMRERARYVGIGVEASSYEEAVEDEIDEDAQWGLLW
ncbi:hypothetical protein BC828DRAFT_409582 [Blastocladiella britannica]|nr:hypothetical protein BC828DRAFT_409582 [Blastocladiella britannica]